MSSITSTIDHALRENGPADLYTLRQAAERALIEREQEIAEKIIGEVVRRFGVGEATVRAHLADTGMSVRGHEGYEPTEEDSFFDDENRFADEDEYEEEDNSGDDDDADEHVAFKSVEETPVSTSNGGDLGEALVTLARAIAARLS